MILRPVRVLPENTPVGYTEGVEIDPIGDDTTRGITRIVLGVGVSHCRFSGQSLWLSADGKKFYLRGPLGAYSLLCSLTIDHVCLALAASVN